ncbi:hypothetical protein SAMD00019534_007040, partial [Acytostelium subglobosum LB1]|uniref:hypothetical protein n=1 Tax=Acytostelium subglobosum LB1 TaxID=1410327 RepID=UPI000644A890
MDRRKNTRKQPRYNVYMDKKQQQQQQHVVGKSSNGTPKETLLESYERKKQQQLLQQEIQKKQQEKIQQDDKVKKNLWNPKPFGDVSKPATITTTTTSTTEGDSNDNDNNDNDNGGMTEAQQKMNQKLKGSRFRWLNEMLYTNDSEKVFTEFKNDPSLFEQYHDGFKTQVEHWPINPLDIIINELSKQPAGKIIADFGCGEARLAETLSKRHTVHSFDLVAKNERVVACDVANVPLANNTVDIVVFCLSLMGTNFLDFVVEANRVLKVNGVMVIAEIESRLADKSVFIKEISNLQFKLLNQNTKNKYFFLFKFQKLKSVDKRMYEKTKSTDNTDILKP